MPRCVTIFACWDARIINSCGLRSLDYVLMFIPVEPAFLLAIDRQPELISEALQNNIMLVSPTTLLVALRTIANLWRYEHQSRNAQKIAERAGRLYDKMRLFVDDMSAIGQSPDKAQESYRRDEKARFRAWQSAGLCGGLSRPGRGGQARD